MNSQGEILQQTNSLNQTLPPISVLCSNFNAFGDEHFPRTSSNWENVSHDLFLNAPATSVKSREAVSQETSGGKRKWGMLDGSGSSYSEMSETEEKLDELPNSSLGSEIWLWKEDGGGKIRRSKDQDIKIRRRYWKCQNSKCCAKKKTDHYRGGRIETTFTGVHNHQAPTYSPKPKVDAQTLRSAKEKLLVHKKKVAEVEAEIIQELNMEQLKHTKVPTRKQLKNIKYYEKTKQMPTTDAMKNIRLLYSPHFAREGPFYRTSS